MLTIRKEQMKVFETEAFNRYVKKVKTLLRTEFPKQVSQHSDEIFDELVIYGIQRANYYEIFSEEDVYHYLVAALVFGKNFDHDDNYVWLYNIVNPNNQRHPNFRSMDVYLKAVEHIERAREGGLD